jgi:hypothetical protein
MMKEYRLTIGQLSGETHPATITIDFESDALFQYTVLHYKDDLLRIDSKSPHLQIAFREIRQKLEEKGKRIFCKGSRLNVHPSGRQLIGETAYCLKLGHRVTSSDVENIFDFEEDESSIASISDQESFYKEWLASIDGTPY